MNIAEKTLQLKKDYDDVYKAGQSSMVDESKIIEKTVSGEYISVDDVSEIPHDVKVKLTSGSRNLWEWFDSLSVDGNGTVQNFLDKYRVGMSGTFVFSCDVEVRDITYSANGNLIYLMTVLEDGTTVYHSVATNKTTNGKFVSVIDATTSPIFRLGVTAHNRWTGGTIRLTNIMLNEGSEALPYEPYKETLTDYSGVSLTRCGGNLLNYDGDTYQSFKTFIFNPSLPAGTYTMQGLFESDDTSTNMLVRVIGVYTSDIAHWSWSKSNTKEQRTYTFTVNEPIDRIYMYSSNSAVNSNGIYVTASEVMLNFGSTALPYEPYKGQTITANADGTVEGITSTSPYMYLTTDNENVTINATYHKSYGMQTEYDRFWDNYQEKGKRTNYIRLFAGRGWNKDTFKPKYNIKPTIGGANSIFQYTGYVGSLKEHLNTIGILLDLSEVNNAGNLFYSAEDITETPDLYLPNCVHAGYLFYGCPKLQSAKIEVSENLTTLNNAFDGCTSLENLIIEGIVATSLSFKDSTKLNKASILNIFSVLSSTVTGQTLTLPTAAVTNAFGSTTATEWTNLVATRTNWTISLV